jgi:5-oxoprolinase (ATP-hydrolysing)
VSGIDTDQQPTHQVWCDVGGTFTDCFVVLPDGTKRFTKVLSNGVVKGTVDEWMDEVTFRDPLRRGDPEGFWQGAKINWLDLQGNTLESQVCVGFCSQQGTLSISSAKHRNFVRYELDFSIEAPVLAARLLLASPPKEPLPSLQVRMGTTRGTNALLTRNGQPTALITTAGFSDLLRIGYQERPELFSLNVRKRSPLHACVVEIDERLAADGSVLKPINIIQAENELRKLYASGIRSIAICLLHSYCNPTHEWIVEALANEIGFECTVVSSRVASKIKAVVRAETSLVDAYLTPIVQKYLSTVAEQFGLNESTRLRVMTSSGGLVSAESYRGKDSVLSGPAGGAVAIAAYAKAMNLPRCIGLDMGGTSTDVCRIEGELQIENETIKAGVRMMVPTLSIHTVAAGGGSVCWFDGVQLRVGPQSAGANPGPACYGRGGPLTISDLNLLSGRIDASTFPFTLDRVASQQKLDEILARVNDAHVSATRRFTSEQLGAGFRRIANEHMAAAVRSISVARGADPRQHALVGFGGAAGQHLCEIAELLGIERVIDPPEAGLLSALGMGMAPVKRSYSHAIYCPLGDLRLATIENLHKNIHSAASKDFAEEGISLGDVQESLMLELRYAGTDGGLMIPFDPLESFGNDRWRLQCIDRFHTLHQQRFGYTRRNRELEAVSLQAEYVAASENHLPPIQFVGLQRARQPFKEQNRVLLRSELEPGAIIQGPALVVSSGSTTSIEQGWTAKVLSDRTLWIEHEASSASQASSLGRYDERVDPVLREVLAHRIAAIAEQMGIALEQTAISVNVKDRRDFSCAVFASNGDLIANAPHVPVHLGAMSETIRRMIVRFARMQPGDCFITNDPYQGGSHLPDITVVTPVFTQDSTGRQCDSPDFFVACRAHHAEIGGIAPGSMAPTSTCLGEEGIVIPPMHLVKQGVDGSASVELLLRSGDHPSRSVPENMADLAAQQAANQIGLHAMTELSAQYGLANVKRYLEHIQAASEAKTRAWIASLGPEIRTFSDTMDDGTAVCVTIAPISDPSGKPTLKIDFSGSGPSSKGNLNANPAIVAAGVMYVIRCALADSLPLNSGVLRCVELTIPEGILNPKTIGIQSDWPAVAGGNVETSQRIVDCLLGALGLAAASQGTMNNFLFGNSSFGYYETIGGGTGATSTASGEHAVHSHMTNTRLTDVEILEKKYPVRLVRFHIRNQSGGSGRNKGGNGIVRQIQALQPLDVSLVTSRRTSSPFGLAGGANGKAGENWLIRTDGQKVPLPSSIQLSIQAGDCILIETPGGGGFGHLD